MICSGTEGHLFAAGDGLISRVELQNVALRVFDNVDSDRDGGISPEEIKAAGPAPR